MTFVHPEFTTTKPFEMNVAIEAKRRPLRTYSKRDASDGDRPAKRQRVDAGETATRALRDISGNISRQHAAPDDKIKPVNAVKPVEPIPVPTTPSIPTHTAQPSEPNTHPVPSIEKPIPGQPSTSAAKSQNTLFRYFKPLSSTPSLAPTTSSATTTPTTTPSPSKNPPSAPASTKRPAPWLRMPYSTSSAGLDPADGECSSVTESTKQREMRDTKLVDGVMTGEVIYVAVDSVETESELGSAGCGSDGASEASSPTKSLGEKSLGSSPEKTVVEASDGRVKEKRKRAPGIQTTLNLSNKAAFEECKVCGTVYNPLYPEDARYHANRHRQVLRKKKTDSLRAVDET